MNTGGYSFDWTLAPVTRETFFAEYFEKKHLVIKRDNPGYWQDLLTFADIDHVVSTMGLYGPEITVTKNTDHAAPDRDTTPAKDPSTDKSNDPASDTDAPATDAHTDVDQAPGIGPADYSFESGAIDPVRVAKLFAEGGTVILSGLHERLPKLARFSRALEAVMSCRVQTNIYMTPGGNQGFRPHYDSHDVLVLQLEGTKEWRIYDSPVELPLASQGFAPGAVPIGEETDRFVLEPGDMAYVPRGLAHDAVATGETSLHITTGLMLRSWADLVAEAAQIMAHKDAAFRRSLPPGYANPGFDTAAMAPQLTELLQRLADTAPAQALINEFRSDFINTRLPRTEGQLAQVAQSGAVTVGTTVGARPDLIFDLAILDGDDGKEPQLVLSCHGAEMTLPPHVEVPLRYALSTAEFKVGDMPGDLDDDGKLVLTRRLIREGLVQAL